MASEAINLESMGVVSREYTLPQSAPLGRSGRVRHNFLRVPQMPHRRTCSYFNTPCFRRIFVVSSIGSALTV